MKTKKKGWIVISGWLVGLIFLVSQASAQQTHLVVALSSSPNSLDPHRSAILPNIQIASHIFDSLFTVEKEDDIRSYLVDTTKQVNELTWELTLKPAILFHDGSELTSDDIIYSLQRMMTKRNKESSQLFKQLSTQKIDRYHLTITTKKPMPSLKLLLSTCFVIKKQPVKPSDLSENAFNTGKALIGTGPYQYLKGGITRSIFLKRFNRYHLDKPFIETVEFRPTKNQFERLQWLVQGEINFVEKLTSKEIQYLRSEGRFKFIKRTDDRLLHLHFDMFRDNSPFIKDNRGKALNENPLKKLKVRQALSLAIDRYDLTYRILEEGGEATGQFVTSEHQGYDPTISVPEYNPRKAKRLLSEAGYKNGFSLTIHGTNGHYMKDQEVIKAIAQMWQAIGIKTQVITLPAKAYFSHLFKHDFSVSLFGLSTHGNLEAMLTALIASPKSNARSFNIGRYSNAEVDRLIDKSVKDFNMRRRMYNFRMAGGVALNDVAILPLYFEYSAWAVSGGLTYFPKFGGRLIANYVSTDKAYQQ